MRGVGVEGTGECLRLVLVSLIGLVEDVVEFGNLAEEPGIDTLSLVYSLRGTRVY